MCSAGPIRFLANEDDLVASIIYTALKAYTRKGRLPILGSDFNYFLLYYPSAGTQALCPWVTIGSSGARNFMLCKKPEENKAKEGGNGNSSEMEEHERNGEGGFQ